jgi:hypothetical protein
MMLAEIYPDEKTTHGKRLKTAELLSKSGNQISATRVSEARLVLAHKPELIEQVKLGRVA